MPIMKKTIILLCLLLCLVMPAATGGAISASLSTGVGTPETLSRALELFTLSARSFPDSWVAGDCHARRAQILDALGNSDEAAMERTRAHEHYVAIAEK